MPSFIKFHWLVVLFVVILESYAGRLRVQTYRVAQKVCHYQMIKKIVLKHVNEIRLIRQIKV